MIPSGGNNGWATQVLSTMLLYPRQVERNLQIALSRKTSTSAIAAAGIVPPSTIEVMELDGTMIDVISAPDALVVDLAFDQSNRHFVVWEVEDSKIYMYWYDPTIPGYVTTYIADGNNPCCQLDDYRDIFVSNSDIYIFYQRGDEIFYRFQRERYLVEHQVPHEFENVRLETCGMGTNLRFTVRVESIDGIVLCAGQTPIRIGTNYVGLNWGEIPWDKSYFSMPT